MNKKGKVYLVGAGPGDPELITIKGLAALRSADTVVYDRLAPRKLLDEAPAHAELINAGKSRAAAMLSQDAINELLIAKARAGKIVCRLKGGDPFVFGRGAEEAIALSKAGIEWSLVPGITSAISAPAYSGIPVTHRGIASGLTIVTGSEDPNSPQSGVDWKAVAKVRGTIVVLMGVNRMEEIAESLIEHGKSSTCSAAVTQNGSSDDQRTVTGSLSDIARLASEAEIRSPAILTVGEVVRLRDTIAWFDTLPLFGKRIVVTRARSQASTLAVGLRELGASVIECPVIRTEPLEDATNLDHSLKQLRQYDWVAFASPNSVAQVWSRLGQLGLDSRALAQVRVAAVGPATKSALEKRGIAPDLVPNDYSSRGLADKFCEQGGKPERTLAFRSDLGRENTPDTLRSIGAEVDEVVAYRTVVDPQSATIAGTAYSGHIDATTFTSSSTVNNLMSSLHGNAERINSGKVVCIGPTTAATARSRGIRVDAIPEEKSILGLISAVKTCLNGS